MILSIIEWIHVPGELLYVSANQTATFKDIKQKG